MIFWLCHASCKFLQDLQHGDTLHGLLRCPMAEESWISALKPKLSITGFAHRKFTPVQRTRSHRHFWDGMPSQNKCQWNGCWLDFLNPCVNYPVKFSPVIRTVNINTEKDNNNGNDTVEVYCRNLQMASKRLFKYLRAKYETWCLWFQRFDVIHHVWKDHIISRHCFKVTSDVKTL